MTQPRVTFKCPIPSAGGSISLSGAMSGLSPNECLECGAWIMNRRKRKPPAGIAMSNEAQAKPRENVNQAAVHNVTSGKAVITNSATLRT